MPHAPNHQQRQDRRVSGGPTQGGTLTLNNDPYGIKNKAISMAGNAIAAPVTKAVSGAISNALPAAGTAITNAGAAMLPFAGPLALAGIAGKIFNWWNEGTTNVQDQAQELAQSVTDQNKRTMRAPMQYSKGIDDVDDYYDNEEELEYQRMFRDRGKPLDGILKFPDEIDPYFDQSKVMAVPPMQVAGGLMPIDQLEKRFDEYLDIYDQDPSVLPDLREMMREINFRRGIPMETGAEMYGMPSLLKYNRGTRRVSLPLDPMMPGQPADSMRTSARQRPSIESMIAQGRQMQLPTPSPMPMSSGLGSMATGLSPLGSMAAGLAPTQHHYLPNVKGNSLKNIIAHEEFKKNPPWIPMAPLGPQDFGGGTHKVAGINPQKYAGGTHWAQGLSNKSDGTFVPDFIKPLVESGGYTPGMDPDSIRYQHLHNTGTLPAIQPMPNPGPYIGPLSDRQMKNQLHEQKMMHNEEKHKKQMMTT